MSEKIEIGIICPQHDSIDLFLCLIKEYADIRTGYTVKSISNWEWENYGEFHCDIRAGIESGLIMIYSLDSLHDIGAYQYKNGTDYITEFWIPRELVESSGSVTDLTQAVSCRIHEIRKKHCINTAYIGIESYVYLSDSIREMHEKSTGIVAWID